MTESLNRLLLEVWREACRHIQADEAVDRLFPLVRSRLPSARLILRRFDVPRGVVETVGVGQIESPAALEPSRTECCPAQTERLLVWARRQEVLHAESSVVEARLPGLLPTGSVRLGGEVLAGSLGTPEAPTGFLLLLADEHQAFRSAHEELFRALLEPLTVVLANDRQLHELTVSREAAEADRRSLLTRLGRQGIGDTVVGTETGLREVMTQVQLVAGSDVPVLILGETGSGKEVVARSIHERSRRTGGPFLRVNCGAIPGELVDSELFGHERGSFTGAAGMRKGWFERADGGTLFLDEVGELPLAAQVRLLRIVQDGTFERVGGERTVHVDVRIVAATHRDLPGMVRSGAFREDLWYRLAVFPVHLPSLRERGEDIPALAAHFAQRSAQRLGMPPLTPSAEDVRLLLAYSWPGNVRELAAVIERAAILGEGRRLEVARALGNVQPPPAPTPVLRLAPTPSDDFLTLEAAMSLHIEAALVRTRGRIEGPDGAARLLDINPHTLRARMRKLGVDWQRFRGTRSVA